MRSRRIFFQSTLSTIHHRSSLSACISHQKGRKVGELGEPPVVRAVRAVGAERQGAPVLSDLYVGDARRLGATEGAEHVRVPQAAALPVHTYKKKKRKKRQIDRCICDWIDHVGLGWVGFWLRRGVGRGWKKRYGAVVRNQESYIYTVRFVFFIRWELLIILNGLLQQLWAGRFSANSTKTGLSIRIVLGCRIEVVDTSRNADLTVYTITYIPPQNETAKIFYAPILLLCTYTEKDDVTRYVSLYIPSIYIFTDKMPHFFCMIRIYMIFHLV